MEDFEGQVAETFPILAGALDVFARVGFEEFETEVGSDDLEEGLLGHRGSGPVGRGAGEGGEVADEVGQVVVVAVGFEAQSVLEGDGEGVDEVQSGQFGEEIGLSVFGALRMSLRGVDPDVSGQVPGCLDQLRPVFAAFDVALVGARGAEGDSEADDETEHGE